MLRATFGDWSVTPSIMAQRLKLHGSAAYRPATGYLENTRYADEHFSDRWYQAALTIEGKIGPIDLTYAGAYLNRTTQYVSDYSDYSYFYDTYYSATPEYFGDNFYNNAGDPINPGQIMTDHEHFTKMSHELRLSSPKGERFQIVGGLFYQRQTNDWTNLYLIPGLADAQSVTGLPGVNYANIQSRTDHDYAAFAQASFDITRSLKLTGGIRAYRYDNGVVGFFGYNAQRSEVGEASCFADTIGTAGHGRPCDNIDATAKGSGESHKISLSWQIDPKRMIYATYSTGFRPGGINRRANAAPYKAEKLANYEIGWKTSWWNDRLRINGDIFLEDLTQAQFPVTSDQNGIEDIVNAGRARSKGIEGQIEFLPVHGLTLSALAAYVDARLRTDLCQYANADFDCSQPSPAGNANALTAPKGSRFPATPRVKATATARYEFPIGTMKAHVQGSLFYQSDVEATLIASDRPLLGRQPAYVTADLALGVDRDGWSAELSAANLFDRHAEASRYASCTISVCGTESIQIIPVTPRLISLRLARRF